MLRSKALVHAIARTRLPAGTCSLSKVATRYPPCNTWKNAFNSPFYLQLGPGSGLKTLASLNPSSSLFTRPATTIPSPVGPLGWSPVSGNQSLSSTPSPPSNQDNTKSTATGGDSSSSSSSKDVVEIEKSGLGKLLKKPVDQSWREFAEHWYEFAWIEGYDAFRRLKLLVIDWEYAYELTAKKVVGRAQPDHCTKLFMDGAKRDAICLIPLAILQALPFSAALIPVYALKFPQYLPSEFKDKFLPPLYEDPPYLVEGLKDAHSSMKEILQLPMFQQKPPRNKHIDWQLERYKTSKTDIDMHDLANVCSTMRNKHMLNAIPISVARLLLGCQDSVTDSVVRKQVTLLAAHRASLDRVFQFRRLTHESDDFGVVELAEECRDRCILPPNQTRITLSKEEMAQRLQLWTTLSRRYGFPTPMLWLLFRPDVRQAALDLAAAAAGQRK